MKVDTVPLASVRSSSSGGRVPANGRKSNVVEPYRRLWAFHPLTGVPPPSVTVWWRKFLVSRAARNFFSFFFSFPSDFDCIETDPIGAFSNSFIV